MRPTVRGAGYEPSMSVGESRGPNLIRTTFQHIGREVGFVSNSSSHSGRDYDENLHNGNLHDLNLRDDDLTTATSLSRLGYRALQVSAGPRTSGLFSSIQNAIDISTFGRLQDIWFGGNRHSDPLRVSKYEGIRRKGRKNRKWVIHGEIDLSLFHPLLFDYSR